MESGGDRLLSDPTLFYTIARHGSCRDGWEELRRIQTPDVRLRHWERLPDQRPDQRRRALDLLVSRVRRCPQLHGNGWMWSCTTSSRWFPRRLDSTPVPGRGSFTAGSPVLARPRPGGVDHPNGCHRLFPISIPSVCTSQRERNLCYPSFMGSAGVSSVCSRVVR